MKVQKIDKTLNETLLIEYKGFQKKTYNFITVLNNLLGLSSYYGNEATTEDGQNFKITIRYPSQGEVQNLYARLQPKLKEIGAKKLSHRGSKYTPTGEITFFISKDIQDNIINELNQKEDERELEYKNSFENVDISQYKPNDKVIEKIRNYRDSGSKINVKAIKSLDKVLTYLYASILLDWRDAQYALESAARELGADESLITAIIEKTDAEEQDERSDIEKQMNLPKSNLLSFEEKHCWLPKKVLQFFIDNNIPVHFGKRSPGSRYDRNGLQWTEIENLTLFPETDRELKIQIPVHTLESGGATTYSGPGTYRSSASQLINGLKHYLEVRNLLNNTNKEESLNEAFIKRSIQAYKPYTYEAKRVFRKILDANKWDDFVEYIDWEYPNGIYEDELDMLLSDHEDELLKELNIQEVQECVDKKVNEDIEVNSDELADNIELTQAEEFPQVGSNLGIYTEIVNAINGEWETINDYNIIMANLKDQGDDDIINVIKDIQDEEYKHVGQLQEILKQFSNDADNIQSGETEAEKQLQGEDIQ